MKAICTTAGLNDRYFYEQFGTCDDALMALNDLLIGQRKRDRGLCAGDRQHRT